MTGSNWTGGFIRSQELRTTLLTEVGVGRPTPMRGTFWSINEPSSFGGFWGRLR